MRTELLTQKKNWCAENCNSQRKHHHPPKQTNKQNPKPHKKQPPLQMQKFPSSPGYLENCSFEFGNWRWELGFSFSQYLIPSYRLDFLSRYGKDSLKIIIITQRIAHKSPTKTTVWCQEKCEDQKTFFNDCLCKANFIFERYFPHLPLPYIICL